MPAAIPFIAAAFSAVGTAVATFGTALTFASGISAGLSAWATLASVGSLAFSLTQKPPELESAGYSLTTSLAGPAGFLPIVFGRAATGGQLVFRESSGSKNRDLWMGSVLSLGLIAGFDGYYLENRLVNWNSSPVRAGSATGLSTCTSVQGVDASSKLYKGALKAAVSLGEHSDTRTFNSFCGGGVPTGNANGRFTGLALLGIKASFGDKGEEFTAEPSGYAVVRGQLLYDPRRDATQPGGSGTQRLATPSTWTYSTNPIIAGLNWALGRKVEGRLLWGIGAELAEIDLPAFIAAANVADANNWTLGGLVSNQDDAFAVLGQMLAAGGATPIARGAQLSLYQNAPRASVFSIGPDDVVGSVRVSSSATLRDRINRVVPSYRQESQFWEFVDGDDVSASQYLGEDGGIEKSDDVEFALVTDAAQAKQLATYYLVNAREFIDVDLTCRPRVLNVDVGDVITLNCPEVAIEGMTFLVTGRNVQPSQGTVSLSLRSETLAKHAFALGQTSTAPPSPTLSGFDPSNPDAPGPTAFAITATSLSRPNRTEIPAIVINGEVDNPVADHVQFHHRIVGAATWTTSATLSKSTTQYAITGITPNTNYEVGVSYVAGIYTSPMTVIGTPTVGRIVSTTTAPGGINWVAPVGETGSIDNVPPALAVDENGQLLPENIGTGVPTKSLADFIAASAVADQALADADEALAEAQDDLDAAIVAANDLIATAQATLQDNIDAKADADEFVIFRNEITDARGDKSALAARLTDIDNTVAGKALATDLSTLLTRVESTEGVADAQSVRLDTVEVDIEGLASASQVESLEAEITSARNGLPDLSAQMTAMRQTVSDGLAEKASASDLTTLESEVITARQGASSLNAKLGTIAGTVADALEGKASSSEFTSLKTEVVSARGTASSVNERLDSVQADINGKADASRVTNVEATVGSMLPNSRVMTVYNYSFQGFGTPDALPALPAGTVKSLDGIGWSFEQTGDVNRVVYLKDIVPVAPSQIVEVSADFYVPTVTSNVRAGCEALDANCASLGFVQGSGGNVIGAATRTTSFSLTAGVGVVTLPSGTVFIRPAGQRSSGDGVWNLVRISWKNVTSEIALTGRVSTVESVTSDLAANKADATRVTQLEALSTAPVNLNVAPSLDLATAAAYYTASAGSRPEPNVPSASFVNVSGIGRVIRVATDSSIYVKNLASVTAGEAYRIVTRVRRVTAATTSSQQQVRLYARCFDAAMNSLSTTTLSSGSATNVTVANGWVDRSVDFTVDDLTAGTKFIQIGVWPNRSGGDGVADIRSLDLFSLSATGLAARVTTMEQAVTNAGGLQARWQIGATVPGATAFIAAQAEVTPGAAPTSSVALGATVLTVFNAIDQDYLPALKVASGNVTVYGNLRAGAGISIGTGSVIWPVALQSKTFSVADGATISFGTNLGAIPSYEISQTGLLPLSGSGESYNLKLTSLTATGAVLSAKINVPGSPTAVSNTTDAAGTTGTPTRIMTRTGAVSESGEYTFDVRGTMTLNARFGELGELYDGYLIIGIFVRKSGVWSQVGTMTVSGNVAGGSGVSSYSYSEVGTFQLGDGVDAFGASKLSISGSATAVSSVTDLFSVSWTAAGSASGTRTALASGAKASVTIIPRN